MKDRLSGLLDGELERHDQQVLLDTLKCDDALRDRWQEYLLIRDALKGRGALGADITARVMVSLDDEPVVLAPQRAARSENWRSSALALAATLAGVAVVGWLALGAGPSPRVAPPLAQRAGTPPVAAVEPARQAASDMQEYLIAHQAQSSSLQFRGGAEHIRTVAALAK